MTAPPIQVLLRLLSQQRMTEPAPHRRWELLKLFRQELTRDAEILAADQRGLMGAAARRCQARFARSPNSMEPTVQLDDDMLLGIPPSSQRLRRGCQNGLPLRTGTPHEQVSLQEVENCSSVLAQERAESPMLLAELASHPLDRQLFLVKNSRRFQTWGLCELLIAECFRRGFEDPRKSVQLGKLAVAVAENFEPASYRPTLVADMQARAWIFLGNAQWKVSALKESEDSFRRAEDLQAQGSGDPLENAELFHRKSALRYSQRRFDEAVELLDQALAIYRRLGARHKTGQALILKGAYLTEARDFERSIPLLRRGLELVDADQDPRSVLAAKHNLVLQLQEVGEVNEASERLEELRPLYAELGDNMNLLRLRWLEARLLRAQGDFTAAESAFQEVRKEFMERGLTYEVAVVAIDLAAVYLEQGRTAEVKELSTEMVTVFRSLEIPRETYAALVLFQRASEMERISFQVVQELSEFLEKAQRHPHLMFQPSS